MGGVGRRSRMARALARPLRRVLGAVGQAGAMRLTVPTDVMPLRAVSAGDWGGHQSTWSRLVFGRFPANACRQVCQQCTMQSVVQHVHYPGPHGKASAPRAMWVQLGCACCTHFAGCSAGELPASALGAAAEWCVAVRGRTPSTRSTACCCPRARSAPRERAASSAAS